MSSPNLPDSSTDHSSQGSSSRPISSVWASAASGSRRGLAPISTSLAAATRPGTSHSPRNPWSPTSAPAQGHHNRQSFRSGSVSSARGPISPPPASGQNQASLNLRSINLSTEPPLASHTPSSSQGAATGGGSSGGGIGSRVSRASPSLSQLSVGSPPLANVSSQAIGQSGSLQKIVITQLSLLLSTIPRLEKDKTKFELQSEQIRKLVESNGMEVFVKYFNKLLASNAAQIWGSSRSSETTNNYPILLAEIHKITTDPDQSVRIADAVNSGDGEIFKDFDLSLFMEHFKMTSLAKTILATAFKTSPKADLRSKADAIMSSNLQNFLSALGNPSIPGFTDRPEEVQPEVIARLLSRLAQSPPRSWTQDSVAQMLPAIHQRYHQSSTTTPFEVSSAAFLFDLFSNNNPMLTQVRKAGPRAFDTIESAKAALSAVDIRDVNYAAVAGVLLFMVIADEEPRYNPSTLIAALREHRGGHRLDWQDVIQALDHDRLTITKEQFLKLYHAMMPLAKDYENFDIQRLWGGNWRHGETHLTFATAFLSLNPGEWDPSEIPRFRRAFVLEDFADAPAETKLQAESAVNQPSVSADATAAIFEMVFRSQETYDQALGLGVIESVINSAITLFVASVSAVPLPWHGGLKDQAMRQLVGSLLKNTPSDSGLALHLLWKRAKTWLTTKIYTYYTQNELQLKDIYQHAVYHGWLHDLIEESRNEFAIDLAALAHGQGAFDIERWLQQTAQALPLPRLLEILTRFLKQKAEDDQLSHREGLQPQTLPLSIKTVYTILRFMGEAHPQISEDELVQLQRLCISAYPRLINYGEGFDEIIDANSLDGHAVSPAADLQMQEHYKLMYGNKKEVRHIIEDLQKYKDSQDPGEQDLFASMIFGLFDEYNCFPEYPNDALATTAVLFGSIINFNLLSRIALQAAVAMVFEAVRDYQPDESMYKFGLQALLHFQGRLEEWKRFAQRLLEIPQLRESQIYSTIERVAAEPDKDLNGSAPAADVRGPVDDMFPPTETRYPDFMCLTVDPPIRHDFYEEPTADAQEEVLFILNNVSERNLDEKFASLQSKVREQHQQWFANYLVDNRIKSQPNYQQLYTDLIDKFDDKLLWSEVIRETYASIIHLLNTESTLNNQIERRYLKTLGNWLGSVTLARNKPIRFRNISFKDLLLEAYDTQRLTLIIPFTCKVMSTAANSVVFRPPNAWTMEIMSLLLELYHSGDIKLNLKFEIEVLCQDLGLDPKSVPPSDILQAHRREPEAPAPPESVTDGIDKFAGMSLLNLHRHFRGNLSPSLLVPELNSLSAQLKHNYQANPVHLQKIHELFADATERAVGEIIAPVVERSVAIATISAIQLVSKDLYLEPSAERFQDATRNAVRNLAGSLALVTCKEPLKQSMEHSIRASAREDSELQIPEATIVMFTNDNIDLVCSYIEKTAEQASVKDADAQIQEELAVRRDGRFNERQVSQWANYVPDPFRQHQGGLNSEQMSIYENFTRSTRGSIGPLAQVSQETARPIPDQLQEQLNTAANLPANSDSLARQLPQGFGNQRMGMSAKLHNGHTPVNGFDGNSFPEQVEELVVAIYSAAVDAIHEDSSRNLLTSQAVLDSWQSLQSAINAAAPRFRDEINNRVASGFLKLLSSWQDQGHAIAEFLATALYEICRNSKATDRAIREHLAMEERLFAPDVAVALLKSDLMSIERVDIQLSHALQKRQPQALEVLNGMVTSFLVNDPPIRLRAEFSNSLAALAGWLIEQPETAAARNLTQKLYNGQPVDSPMEQDEVAKEAKYEYIFEEWARLWSSGQAAPAALAFVRQLDQQKVLGDSESICGFLRTCVESGVRFFEHHEIVPVVSIDKAYSKIDALAKLIALLVVHQGKADGVKSSFKAEFFDNILWIITHVISHHYRVKADRFNQRVYFRLLSNILNELDAEGGQGSESYVELVKCFAENLMKLSPTVFPGFSFAWMSLVSHRCLLPELLQGSNEAGWEIFSELLETLLAYTSEPQKLYDIPLASKDQYRGALRILLILHHDFPEYLADNHYRLLNSIPSHCTQMRNLILHADPPSISDQVDQFGTPVAAQDVQKRSPRVRGNPQDAVQASGILDVVDSILDASDFSDLDTEPILRAVRSPKVAQTGVGLVPIGVDQSLLNALVIHIVQHWEAQPGNLDAGFTTDSAHFALLEALVDQFDPEARYYFISAICNNLRYENCHTLYFIRAIPQLFRAGQADAKSVDIQKQIRRCLLERMVAHRPHPWGLQVVVMELLRTPSNHFWELPLIKSYPDVENMFKSLMQQMQATRSVS